MSDLAKNTRAALAGATLFGFGGTERSGVARRAIKEMGLVVPTDEAAIIEALNQPPATDTADAPAEGSETA